MSAVRVGKVQAARTWRGGFGATCLALLVGLTAPVVEARKEPIAPGAERFKFWGGAGLNAFDSQVRVRVGGSVVGASIDLEDDLGLEESIPVYGVGGLWRFKPRQRLRVTYGSFNRSATTVLDERIEIGDEVFEVGATIDSGFDISLTSVDYLYSLLKRKDFELAASGGIYWTELKFRITGEAQAGPVTGDGEFSTAESGPLPAFGFNASYFIAPRWSLTTGMKAFFISISDIKGQLVSLDFGTEYYFTRNVGIGASLESLRLKAEVDEEDYPWEVDLGYMGPQIYFVGKF